MPILLGWGASPLACPELAGVRLRVVARPPAPGVPDLRAALEAALAHPVGARPLSEVATARSRVVVVVSGDPRDEPRAELFAAVRRALGAVPDDHLTVAVAAGAGAPGSPGSLGLPPDVLGRHRVVSHDPRDGAAMIEMGRTSRGTPVRVNRCLAEADLVVTTGCIRPHAAAGFAGGARGIFPGLGHAEAVRKHRELEADAGSSLGEADRNPCREDLEEAARRLGRDTYMLDVVQVGGVVAGAVAGDLVYAHREGVRLARPFCEVAAEPADAVLVSAPLPAASSLARAVRLLPPAGILLKDGGTVILAAECPEGTGLLAAEDATSTLRRHLPARHRLFLLSGMDERSVAGTFAAFAPSLAWALERARAVAGKEPLDVAVLPDARDLVPRIPEPRPPD